MESGFDKILKNLIDKKSKFKDKDSGFSDSLRQFIGSQKEIEKNLESLPFKYERFSVEELGKIIEVRNKLIEFIEECNGLAIVNQNNEKLFNHLNKIINYLDTLDLWESKFATGEINKIQENDSIYYKTRSGISLRLKMANIDKGIKEIIQPLMESITFEDKDIYYPLEKPIIGSIPNEYCSEEFLELQNQRDIDKDFSSRVRKYYKDDKLYFVQGPENLYHHHPGNPVNKIYF